MGKNMGLEGWNTIQWTTWKHCLMGPETFHWVDLGGTQGTSVYHDIRIVM